MDGRLAFVAPREVGIRAVLEQPARPGGIPGPRHHVDERRHTSGNPVDVDAEAVQQLERREVAAAARDMYGDAVRGIGARLEQDLGERQVANRAHRAPQRRARQLRMPVPVVLAVRIRAERAQATRDFGEAVQTAGAAKHAGMTRIQQRLPLLRAARSRRKRGVAAESRLHPGDVPQHQRRVQRCRRDPGMQREQPFGAAGGAAGGAPDELVDGGVERERARVDLVAQRVPGRESVLACDHGLRVVQRERELAELGSTLSGEGGQHGEASQRRRILRRRGVQQRLGLLLQLFEIRTIGKCARRHTTSMLEPVVRKQAARRCMAVSRGDMTVGLALRANPQAPFERASTR